MMDGYNWPEPMNFVPRFIESGRWEEKIKNNFFQVSVKKKRLFLNKKKHEVWMENGFKTIDWLLHYKVKYKWCLWYTDWSQSL